MRHQNRGCGAARRPVGGGLKLPACGSTFLLVWALAAAVLAADPQKPLRLVVDYGDGVQLQFKELPWGKGMTVLDALATAQKHPRGIKFQQRGRGSSALVTEIDGLKNEGSGKNWMFSVNGKTAEVGAGSYELQQGDEVLWEFKAYD